MKEGYLKHPKVSKGVLISVISTAVGVVKGSKGSQDYAWKVALLVETRVLQRAL